MDKESEMHLFQCDGCYPMSLGICEGNDGASIGLRVYRSARHLSHVLKYLIAWCLRENMRCASVKR